MTNTTLQELPAAATLDEGQLVIPGVAWINLTPQEESLVDALLRDRGRIVFIDELLECLAGSSEEVSAVHTAVYRIRVKLAQHGYAGPVNVRARGYRMSRIETVDQHNHEFHCTICGGRYVDLITMRQS